MVSDSRGAQGGAGWWACEHEHESKDVCAHVYVCTHMCVCACIFVGVYVCVYVHYVCMCVVYACVRAKSHQSCLTLWDPMDCSPPGSSVHGILQARILEWVAVPSSRVSSWARDWTCLFYISCIGRQVLYHWVTWETHVYMDVYIFVCVCVSVYMCLFINKYTHVPLTSLGAQW